MFSFKWWLKYHVYRWLDVEQEICWRFSDVQHELQGWIAAGLNSPCDRGLINQCKANMTPVLICFLGTHDLYFFLLQAFLQACRSFIIHQVLAVDSEVVFNQVAKFLVSLPLHATGWTWFFKKHGGVLAPVDMYRYISKIKFTCPVFFNRGLLNLSPASTFHQWYFKRHQAAFPRLEFPEFCRNLGGQGCFAKDPWESQWLGHVFGFSLLCFASWLHNFLLRWKVWHWLCKMAIYIYIYFFSVQLFFTNN